MLTIFGACYLVPVVAAVANAILSTFALTRENRALYIANIVCGFMMGDAPTNAIAGIFGLILLNRKAKQEPKAE